MKAANLKKHTLVNNPHLVEAPTFKLSLFKSKQLSLTALEAEMKDVQERMLEYSKNLEPDNAGLQTDLFIGVAIVVLTMQRDQLAVTRSQDYSILCGGKDN